MPEVRAKQTCFIDNRLRQPGEVFHYDGDIGPKSDGNPLELTSEQQASSHADKARRAPPKPHGSA